MRLYPNNPIEHVLVGSGVNGLCEGGVYGRKRGWRTSASSISVPKRSSKVRQGSMASPGGDTAVHGHRELIEEPVATKQDCPGWFPLSNEPDIRPPFGYWGRFVIQQVLEKLDGDLDEAHTPWCATKPDDDFGHGRQVKAQGSGQTGSGKGAFRARVD